MATENKTVSELMASYGFAFCETGGGCTAYEKVVGDTAVMVTEDEGPEVPPDSDETPVCVGVYGGEYRDEQVLVMRFESLEMFLATL